MNDAQHEDNTVITKRPYVSRAIYVFMAFGAGLQIYNGGFLSLFYPKTLVLFLVGSLLAGVVVGGINLILTSLLARTLIQITAYSSDGIDTFRLLNVLVTVLNYGVAFYLTWVGYEGYYALF